MAANLSDVFAYIAIFSVLFLFLRLLLRIAQKAIDRDYPQIVPDDFYNIYGYGFDYVMVFPVKDEEDDDISKFQKDFSLSKVLGRLTEAGLETKQFYSCQRDELYVKIRARPEKLRAEASRINYRLLMDSERIRQKLNLGKKRAGDYVWRPIHFVDEFKQTPISPYEYIYCYYDADANREGLYRSYYTEDGQHSLIFRPALDRINLLISIIQAKSGGDQGAGINITKLLNEGVLLAAYPLHDYEGLRRLQRSWLTLFSAPWKQPIHEIKDYFGERIGFYFLFIGHYTTCLLVPAIGGAAAYTVQKLLDTEEYLFMPIFATLMMFWTSVFLSTWRQKQARYAMYWGTSDLEEAEQDSALFKGLEATSPIDGRPFTYFSSEIKFQRESKVFALIQTMIVGVIIAVAGIYYFQYLLTLPAYSNSVTLLGFNLGSIIGSLLNTVVIVTLNMLYQGVAIRLNNYENHRTDTEYENYLISKIFLFQMINSFAGLTYVSFIKDFIGIHCVNATCTGDVQASLSTIFLSALVTRAIIEIFVRKLSQERKNQAETKGLPPGVAPGLIEEQYFLAEYPVITGTLTDYAGLVVQFGYTTLFVAAFSLAPTIAFISCFLQIRIDGWKLCQAYRRPQPRIADCIGVWEDMLKLISYIGVIYNFGLIFFTGQYLQDVDWQRRWIYFALCEHAAFLGKYLLERCIVEVDDKTSIQLERQAFIISKLIKNTQDEDDEDFQGGAVSNMFVIHNYDDDWAEDGEMEEWGSLPGSKEAEAAAAGEGLEGGAGIELGQGGGPRKLLQERLPSRPTKAKAKTAGTGKRRKGEEHKGD